MTQKRTKRDAELLYTTMVDRLTEIRLRNVAGSSPSVYETAFDFPPWHDLPQDMRTAYTAGCDALYSQWRKETQKQRRFYVL